MSGIIAWSLIVLAWTGIAVFLARFITQSWANAGVGIREICDVQGCGRQSVNRLFLGIAGGICVLYVCPKHTVEATPWTLRVVDDGDVG